MENISPALFLGVRLTLSTYGENATDNEYARMSHIYTPNAPIKYTEKFVKKPK